MESPPVVRSGKAKGVRVLHQGRAKETVSSKAHDVPTLSISAAFDEYATGPRVEVIARLMSRRPVCVLRALVEPMLGSVPVSKLKRGQIRKLIDDLANTRACVRTNKGARLCTAPVS
jgi:hypothetical protein